MTTLRNKRVLITGGSRGIGRLVADRLALRGEHVVLWARNPGDLARAAAEIARGNGSVEWAAVDVGDRVAVARAAAALRERGGPGMFAGVNTRWSFLLPILRPDEVADRIVDAIEHDRRRVLMPRIVAITWLARLLPVSWFDAIAGFLGIDRGMETFVGRMPPWKAAPGVGRGVHHEIHA